MVIDDRLPTRNGQLICLHSDRENEFWPALFEKAYAKFYGGYANIVGGISLEAGVDFTGRKSRPDSLYFPWPGGVPERISVEEFIMARGSGPEKLHHLLQLSHDNGALISCSLGGPHAGEAVTKRLQASHTYTVIGMTKVKGGRNRRLVIPLIRLRDPHGKGVKAEWSGDWGDDSELWDEIPIRRKKALLEKENNGEFYISFNKDFLRYFREVDIIHLNPLRLELNEDRQTRKFDLAEFRGEWRRGQGGANQSYHENPQFPFSLSNCRDGNSTCTVVIALAQDARRSEKASIGFKLFKGCSTEPLDASFVRNGANLAEKPGTFVNMRDVSQSFLLPAGDYTVIPGTFAKEEAGTFHLRLFVDSRWRCDAGDVSLTPVRDYTAAARLANTCHSLWSTLLCCRCYCCCLPRCRRAEPKDEEYRLVNIRGS